MRNCGISGKIASLATSFNRLASPSSFTLRGSARRSAGASDSRSIHGVSGRPRVAHSGPVGLLGREDAAGDLDQFPVLLAGQLLKPAEGVVLVEVRLLHQDALGLLDRL